MSSISISGLHKSYKSQNGEVIVFRGFSLEIDKLVTAFFGPNGCGKTTLLYLIAGLLQHDGGSIQIKVSGSHKVRFGYVFQTTDGFLFPWMSNLDNIAIPLKLKSVGRQQRHHKTRSLVKELEFDFPLEAFPYQLSGGQRQMVMIARALINDDVDILLLDEPFENLDYLNALKMLMKLERYIRARRILTLFVSHTVEEAIFLADRIVALSDKPTRILKKIDVPFPYRSFNILHSPEFLNIKERVLKHYPIGLVEVECHERQS